MRSPPVERGTATMASMSDTGAREGQCFYEELRQPDQTTLRFTPLGLATSHVMRPEDSAEYLRSLVALPLSDAVDAEVAQTVARLRAVFYHGLFDYDLFTAASDLAYLAVEGALRRRFMVGYGGRVPFVHKDRTEYVEARSFDDVHEAVRRTGPYALGKGWRLAGISAVEHPGFDCSFTALLTWARREGLLQGQRNRVIERALVRLRNLIAHPERFHRTHPVSAALPIRDAIEVINRLWGAMSDGGRLYPAPARRTVVVLARNPDGTAQWTGHPESLHERVAQEADWVTYLLRAVPSDALGLPRGLRVDGAPR